MDTVAVPTGAIADFAVIGGGPAGLFGAIAYAEAARAAAASATPAAGVNAARVLIVERMPGPARKLLASGSGQCNISHAGSVQELLLRYAGSGKAGEAARFLKPALYGFDNDALQAWFGARGLSFRAEPNGKIFPTTRKSRSVLDILLAELRRLGIELITGARCRSIAAEPEGFRLELECAGAQGEAPAPGDRDSAAAAGGGAGGSVHARAVLVAAGGASYPGTGSSGDGYSLTAALGLRVVDPRPALAPVYADDPTLASLSGLSFERAGLSLWREGRKHWEREGELLLTHKGVSGPLILDSSRDILPGDELRLRFAMTGPEACEARIDESVRSSPKRLAKALLCELGLPRSMAERFAALAGLAEAPAAALTRESRRRLAGLAAAYPLRVAALGGWEAAMATAGGVTLAELAPKTMESRSIPGLYFAGEVLDYVGDTGGYNIQAAFSTGRLAGASAAEAALRRAASAPR